MGEVLSIFAGGKLHRQLLDRIERLELTSLNGQFALHFIIATEEIQPTWLLNEVAFRFIVDGGKRVLTGRSSHSYGSADELNRYKTVEFYNPETGKQEELGEWSTLEIVLLAGKEQKSFVASKEGKSEAKQTS